MVKDLILVGLGWKSSVWEELEKYDDQLFYIDFVGVLDILAFALDKFIKNLIEKVEELLKILNLKVFDELLFFSNFPQKAQVLAFNFQSFKIKDDVNDIGDERVDFEGDFRHDIISS